MSATSRSLIVGLITVGVFAIALSIDHSETLPAVPGIAPETAPPPAIARAYWKGNLHTHSLWSDGDDYPEMIVDWYKQHGYQFLALTEHNLIAEGEKWVDAESNPTRKGATEKYFERFGNRWPEFRTGGEKK